MRRRLVSLFIVVFVFSGCGVVRVVKPPEKTPTGPLKSMRFEGGNEGDAPAGWEVKSHSAGDSAPVEGDKPDHKMEFTKDHKHSGKMSALLGPIGKVSADRGAVGRFCGETPYPGFPVRITTFIKSQKSEQVGIGAFVGAEDTNLVSWILIGPPSWKKYELVSGVADKNAPVEFAPRQLCITFQTVGSNRIWIDDITFTKVDFDTLPPEKVQPVAIDNFDMEQSDRRGNLAIWNLISLAGEESARPGFTLRSDTKIKQAGSSSLRLSSDRALESPPGDAAIYCIDEQPFLGKVIRVAGWFRIDVGDEPGAQAVFGVSATPFSREEAKTLAEDDPAALKDNYRSHLFIRTPKEWTRFQQYATVPKTTTNLCIDIRLDQVGSVWADDLSVHVVEP